MKPLLFSLMFLFVFSTLFSQNIWLNEFHYDNVGADEGEFLEIVLEDAGSYTLSDFTITLYNGNGGATYGTLTLDSFTTGAVIDNFTIYYKLIAPIQNGAPDGIAIDYQGILIPGQFLSYEGTFEASGGPANGVTSIDIGVSEGSTTPIGESLQLFGSGSVYSDFIWQEPALETPGELNNGQTIGGTPEPTIIVVSPNGGEQWEQGSTHDITWTSINFDDNVKIELGMVWNRTREVLIASTENDGSWEWNIPIDQTISDWYVIIISDAIDGDPSDQSDDPFSIIEPIPVTPYTIYEIQYSTTGSSPHVGELVETTGVVTAIFEYYFFIQDGPGAWNGIAIYPMQSVEIGDEIVISGMVDEYFDKTEITDIINMTVLGTADIPAPVIISTSALASSEEYESVLVKVQDVTVTNEDLGNGEWEIDDGSGPCIVGHLGDYTYVPVLDDFIYDITGVSDYTYGAFKLEPRTDDDLNITGLDVNPLRLLFLTYEHCSNGKVFTITNYSESNIVIESMTTMGFLPSAEWSIEDFNLQLPYNLEAGSSLEFNVIVNLYTENFTREIVSDTLYIETNVINKKITILYNSNLNSNVENHTIATANTLIGNYPNPFNPETTIYFTTEQDENAELVIYNIKGQLVKTLVNIKLEAGNYSTTWNGKDKNERPVASGIYFYKLKKGNETYTRKMLLLK
ncbi:MAG: T9SS type A sorting domain-containing protein [Candidatus Cloacimonetes bacterium]|nr:T9SS type A sorting domain-containing protein [Candidatus Cloacimonadota bacterium]